MKKFTQIIAVMLFAIAAITLVGCSTYKSVKKTYEKEGYKQSDKIEEYNAAFKSTLADLLNEDKEEEYGVKINVHLLVKDETGSALAALTSDMVVILEFDCSEEKMKEYMNDEDMKYVYGKLQDTGYVKGTCVYVYGTGTAKSIWEEKVK